MIEPTQEQMYMADLVKTGKLRLPNEGETEAEYVQFCQDRLRGAFSNPGIMRFAVKNHLTFRVTTAKTKDDLRDILKSLVDRLF